jgi:hypothetical protein
LNLADGDWSLEVVGEEGLEVVGEEGLEVGCNKRKVIGQAGRSRRYEKAGIVWWWEPQKAFHLVYWFWLVWFGPERMTTKSNL